MEEPSPYEKERSSSSADPIKNRAHKSSFMLSGERPPRCQTCQVRLTVKHLLEDCVEYRDLKDLSGIQGDISKILSNDKRDIDNLLTFLDRAGLTKKNVTSYS
ncbi:hypothetical protein JTB14_027456 [Gonioctena quinquepunctata]|nr:hypothetical protein JTB14_027456 [Gonioctena quinquepunctata]